ncbi:MAG TPA: hypothetical protein LFV92_06670 [Rickettsia endosymbiont of Ceroptres masudai]|nr:hypothetical protein [Rickettsia endosymbiont of Ceroptres masudai]
MTGVRSEAYNNRRVDEQRSTKWVSINYIILWGRYFKNTSSKYSYTVMPWLDRCCLHDSFMSFPRRRESRVKRDKSSFSNKTFKKL